MSSITQNLKLLKKDKNIDGNNRFNIEEILNNNWNKIDENSVMVENRITELENTKAKKIIFNITVPSSEWIDEGENGFTKTVSVQGLLETDNPLASLSSTGLLIDEKEKLRTELSKIADGITSNDSIKFFAKIVPDINIPLLLEVVR